MIQFFANNYELVLPEDFSTSMIDENALITRNGEYSLDITISLLERNNALAFGMPQRLNALNLPKEVDARMIYNLKVTSGRFIVMPKSTDTTITIQFVAGNSEMNFLAKQSKKIWELDFGTESAVDYQRALFSIEHPGYGEVIENNVVIGFNKFVCVPVKFTNLIANDYSIRPGYYLQQDPQIDGVANIVIQPYLLHYVNKLPELLGFELVENILNSDLFAKEIFMTNKIQSLRYSDALPDVTITEFLDAIEEFFNVFFYITKDKKCHILNRDSIINNKTVVKLRSVLDRFERSSEKSQSDPTSIAYELTEDEFQRFQKIDDEILKACVVNTYANSNEMKNSITQSQINKFIIHKTANNNREYIFTPEMLLNMYRIHVPATSGFCYYVNKFSKSSESENPLTLKIRPLIFTYVEKSVSLYDDQAVLLEVPVPFQLPYESANLYIQQDQFLLNAIQSNLVNLPRKSSIEIGIYSGMIDFFGVDVKYPFSYLDNNPEFWIPEIYINSPDMPTYESSFNTWITQKYLPVCSKTLRLTGDDGIFQRYFKNLRYDHETMYVFIIEDTPDLNTSNLFEHNNQFYIPVKFERTISKEKNLVTGYFYRMKS